MTEPSATGGASLPASPPDQLVLDGTPAGGLWGDAWRRFRRHRLAMLGSAFFLLVVILAMGAPLAAPMDPNDQNLRQIYQPPSASHWLGTDALGRDVWSRLVYASRISMSVGILAVAIYMVIGIVLGAISGYVGGWPDMLIQRITELVMTFPTLLIIMTIVALVGPSLYNVFLVIGLLSWPGVVRLVRGEFLSLRERDFVLAARCVGVRPARIIFRHILPNALASVIVAATFGVASAILTETSLSFLGLGVPPPTPSWGNMINDAQKFNVLASRPWIWLPPGLAIALSVLSINFIGDGLRDSLDPRLKQR